MSVDPPRGAGDRGPGRTIATLKRRKRLWIASLLLLLSSLWPAFHAGTALVVSRDIGEPDAIVMLASHESERLPAAASVARQYPASRVLLTVPITVTKWNCSRCPERPAQLEAEGVSPDRIVELGGDPAANTYGEALAVQRWVSGQSIKKLLVITSPYHTRRALRAFEHVVGQSGVEVGVLPASAFSPANPRRWWLSEYDRGYVPYEWTGIIYYRLKYGVPLK